MKKSAWLSSIIAPLLIVVFLEYYLTSNWYSRSASIFVSIKNLSPKSIRGTVSIDANPWGQRFSNWSYVNYKHEANISVKMIKAGEFEIQIAKISSQNQVTVEISNITVLEEFCDVTDFSEQNLPHIRVWDYPEDVEVSAFLIVYATTNFGTIPVGSVYYNTGNKVYEYRIYIKSLIRYVALPLIYFLLLGLLLLLLKRDLRYPYPVATLFISLVSILFLSFLGSGYEIQMLPYLSSFAPYYSLMSIVIHGSSEHLLGNLSYFLIVGSILERWVKKNTRSFFLWYLIPFYIPVFLSLIWQLCYGKFGFGLSFSIEIMTVALWKYIMNHWKSLVKSKTDVIMMVLSGVPFCVFYNWFTDYLFLRYQWSKYYSELAIGHIVIGISALFLYFIILPLLPRLPKVKKIKAEKRITYTTILNTMSTYWMLE